MRILRAIKTHGQFGVYVLFGKEKSIGVAFESVYFSQFEKDMDVLERPPSRSVGLRGLKISYMSKLGKLDLGL